MTAPVITIIVPIYNVATYLHRCLQSIATQSEPSIEVLLIDDGSTDNSLQLCDEFAKKDSRFRVFSKINEGQGVARNFGIEKARGRYIAFVDGDDWIEAKTYEHCIATLESSGADFANFGLDYVDQTGQARAHFNKFRNKLLTGNDIAKAALLDDQIYSSPCNKVYRRSVIEEYNIRFPAVRGCEDVYFSRAISLVAKSTTFTKTVYYHALIRSGSTTRSIKPAFFEDAQKVIQAEKLYFLQHSTSSTLDIYFKAHIVKFISYLIIQAAFQIRNDSDFNRCLEIADSCEFFRHLRNHECLKKLRIRNQLIAWACRYPPLVRRAATVARWVKWSPY